MGARVYGGAAARTTLTAGITSASTSIGLADGSTWPSTGQFSVVLDRGLSGEEKILVTRSGNTLTVVTRGYDGTTAAAHSTGAVAEHCGTAVDFQEANDHTNGTAHLAGTIIGQTIGPASAVPATNFNAGVLLLSLTAAVVNGRKYRLESTGALTLAYVSGTGWYVYATKSTGAWAATGTFGETFAGGQLTSGASSVHGGISGHLYYTATSTGNVTFTMLLAGDGTGSYAVAANALSLTLVDCGT